MPTAPPTMTLIKIHQQDRDGPLHQDSFHEDISVTGFEPLISQMRELLGHRNGDAGEQSPFQHFDSVILQRAERADEQQGCDHDHREGHDGDGLEGERKRIDKFLNGERNDQRKQPDGDGIGKDEAQDPPFHADQEAEVADDRLKKINLLIGLVFCHGCHPYRASPDILPGLGERSLKAWIGARRHRIPSFDKR